MSADGFEQKQTTEDRPPRLSELVASVDDVDEPSDNDEVGQCMICGLDGPVNPVTGTNGVFSDAFTSSDKLNDGDGVCWRCEYLSNAMDYRRYHWVATTDEIRVIKERPELLDVLLDPPEGPWMAKYKDESDFLTVLNGWITAQTLNMSRDRYRLLVDKKFVDINRESFAEMVEFGQRLRASDNAPAKRVLLGDISAADLSRYDIGRDDVNRIQNELAGREDWRIAVQLIQ